mmetsp:Transcript_54740/g.116907  ORF Transcript_54740/g.116907 Transcript_54740/m.116907 type:complete len:610 (-) Transcript_54740:159-1988(-)
MKVHQEYEASRTLSVPHNSRYGKDFDSHRSGLVTDKDEEATSTFGDEDVVARRTSLMSIQTGYGCDSMECGGGWGSMRKSRSSKQEAAAAAPPPDDEDEPGWKKIWSTMTYQTDFGEESDALGSRYRRQAQFMSDALGSDRSGLAAADAVPRATIPGINILPPGLPTDAAVDRLSSSSEGNPLYFQQLPPSQWHGAGSMNANPNWPVQNAQLPPQGTLPSHPHQPNHSSPTPPPHSQQPMYFPGYNQSPPVPGPPPVPQVPQFPGGVWPSGYAQQQPPAATPFAPNVASGVGLTPSQLYNGLQGTVGGPMTGHRQQEGKAPKNTWSNPPAATATVGGKNHQYPQQPLPEQQPTTVLQQQMPNTSTSQPLPQQASGSIPHRSKTTVMMRNMPETYLRDDLTAMLNREGFLGKYDFVYMPMNFRTKASFGYAFVNLVTHDDAQCCHDKFQGFADWQVPTAKICEVSWSDMHQGLAAHVDRYRNSPVMHDSVPDEYKPVMYQDGVRALFPPPTKKLRQPRIRRLTEGNEEDDEGNEDGIMPSPSSPSRVPMPSMQQKEHFTPTSVSTAAASPASQTPQVVNWSGSAPPGSMHQQMPAGSWMSQPVHAQGCPR